jgi:hypothetical protein
LILRRTGRPRRSRRLRSCIPCPGALVEVLSCFAGRLPTEADAEGVETAISDHSGLSRALRPGIDSSRTAKSSARASASPLMVREQAVRYNKIGFGQKSLGQGIQTRALESSVSDCTRSVPYFECFQR